MFIFTEGRLSFPNYRRVAIMIMVSGAPPHYHSMKMHAIGFVDLADAQHRYAGATNV